MKLFSARPHASRRVVFATCFQQHPEKWFSLSQHHRDTVLRYASTFEPFGSLFVSVEWFSPKLVKNEILAETSSGARSGLSRPSIAQFWISVKWRVIEFWKTRKKWEEERGWKRRKTLFSRAEVLVESSSVGWKVPRCEEANLEAF